MSYSTSNPPVLIAGGLTSGAQPRLWVLTGTDATTTVDGAGYVTNGSALGMKKGDLVFYVKTDASPITCQIHIVSAVTVGGSADLSDGTAITATNSD